MVHDGPGVGPRGMSRFNHSSGTIIPVTRSSNGHSSAQASRAHTYIGQCSLSNTRGFISLVTRQGVMYRRVGMYSDIRRFTIGGGLCFGSTAHDQRLHHIDRSLARLCALEILIISIPLHHIAILHAYSLILNLTASDLPHLQTQTSSFIFALVIASSLIFADR